MALITCPDCSNQMSDAAPACPKCGRPRAAKPTTIEATGKNWKVVYVVSFVLTLGGCVTCMNGSAQNEGAFGAGAALFGIGIVVWCVAAIGSWWQHG